MRLIIFFAAFLFILPGLQAQRFGGNPPSVKWKQVNNKVAKVIFPIGMDTTAMRIAAVEDLLDKHTLPTIGRQRKKIDIVLHPNTIVSNGYVALGPFRSEFYLTPSQNSFELGSLRWQDMLAIHEYRHVQQYNNFNTGLSHIIRILFGQQGQELANAAAVPNWFWEGDAVYQETLVSPQGRGRLPFFYDDYRSLWLAGKDYSYMKLRNGSLKDFTPDHYRLGYMLVAYGRQHYGDDFWRKVTHDAASYKGLFYPFQQAIKQYSGKSFPVFTKEAFDWFKKQAVPQSAGVQKNKHFIADQAFPAYTDSQSVIYVKTSYNRVPSFIKQAGGTEQKIRVKDVSIDNQFSYSGGKIVYASYRPAARWGWNDYNELQVLDIASGVQKRITRRSKYFAPALSRDGRTIVAVEVQPGSQSCLHLLDAETGKLLTTVPNPGKLFYTYPQFLNDTQLVVAIREPAGQMALALINIRTGSAGLLTPASWRVLGNPVVQQDTIYFTAADRGYDRLFAFVLGDGKLYRLNIATKGIGIYQPAVSLNKILFTSFTADGYRLQEIEKKEIDWNLVNSTEWVQPLTSFGIDFTKNNAAGILSAVQVSSLETKKYPQIAGLFNFHSLLPYITDPDYTLSLIGNNVLNTMQSELFVSYNRNEGYKQTGANFRYGGLFPYINLGASYIFDRRDFLRNNRPVYWNEGQANAGLSLPLSLSRGRSLGNFKVGSDYVLKSVSYQGVYKDSFATSHLGYINSYISFTHQVQQARQHIFPRFAQLVYLNYRTAVQSVTARQLLVSGTLYFPGLALNHNFVVNLAFQNRDTVSQYRYS
ncbi:MAG: hypothetical protein ABI813_03955, partial [Bacteroidota bacterium]